MNATQLYTLVVPWQAQTPSSSSSNRQTSSKGVLQTDIPPLETTGLEPNERRLRGRIAGAYADLMAGELRELTTAGFETVPVFTQSATAFENGYYAVKNSDVEEVEPGSKRLYSWMLRLEKEGTRESHYRALATSPVDDLRNDFGNDTTAEIVVPASATDVHWYEAPSTTADAAVQRTVEGEFGTLEVYDAEATALSKPILLYDLPYGETGVGDCVLWDTYDRAKMQDGVNSWARAFSTGHEFNGAAMLDTRQLRLKFDTAGNALSAWRWDDANSTWASVSLGTSDWQLASLDVRAISPARVEARVGFENPTSGETYAFRMLADRGKDAVQWLQPANESDPAPSGLETLLGPVASSSLLDVQPTRGLQAKNEVPQ